MRKPDRTQGHPIGSPLALGVSMAVEGDGRHALAVGHRLVDVPSIESGIGGQMSRKEAQDRHRADVQGEEIRDVILIEGLGVLGEHHIAIDRVSGTDHPRAIAPEILFLFLLAAIGLLFIATFLDPHLAITIASWLLLLRGNVP